MHTKLGARGTQTLQYSTGSAMRLWARRQIGMYTTAHISSVANASTPGAGQRGGRAAGHVSVDAIFDRFLEWAL